MHPQGLDTFGGAYFLFKMQNRTKAVLTLFENPCYNNLVKWLLKLNSQGGRGKAVGIR